MSALQKQIMALSPAGYWPLTSDTVSGTTVRDLSGNGRNGTTSGSPAMNRTLLGKTCMDFDGTDDFISIPDANAWTVDGTGISMFLFSQADALFGGAQLFRSFMGKDVNQDAGGEWAWYASVTPDSKPVFSLFNSARNAVYLSGTYGTTMSLTAMEFQTVTITTAAVNIYVNAVLVNTITTTSGTVAANGTDALEIGRSGVSSNSSFDGAMTHVAVIPGIITPTQIANVYRAGLRSSVVGG